MHLLPSKSLLKKGGGLLAISLILVAEFLLHKVNKRNLSSSSPYYTFYTSMLITQTIENALQV